MARHKHDADSTPSIPVSTPPKTGPDWAMQAFIDLKVAMTSMEASIKSLADKVDDLKDEQSKVKSKMNTVEKQIYAATAVITVVIAIGGYFGNKAIEFGMDMAKRSSYTQAVQQPVPAQHIQQPTQYLPQQPPPRQ